MTLIDSRRLGVLWATALTLSLAACQPRAAQAQSQVVEGLRLDYGVTDAATVAAHSQGHAETQMHGGPIPGADHVTLAVFDAKTNARIDDATVSLTVAGPGHPGGVNLPLEPMEINGTTTYGGYVFLRHRGRYRLTFDVARAGRQHDPARAVFSYEQTP